MSLATQCSACGTMFRVVQDQLRVSEGWVRCGRCDHVFNALDALVDLDAETADATATVEQSHEADLAAPADARDWPDLGAPMQSVAHDDLDPAPTPDANHDTQWDHAPIDREPALPPAAAPMVAMAAQLQPSAVGNGLAPVLRTSAFQPLPAAPVTRTTPAATPGFMRQAERDARWTSPAMRAALAGVALMLLAMLAIQVVYQFRDEVAARSASAGDLLRSACARWGCRIELPRRLQEVTLESHTLQRISQQPKAVKLAINLRNRGGTDLALPAIDVSLTDATGQLIARRALLPGDFRIDPPVIARGVELPLEVVLSAGDQSIVGYTVELFYP